MTRLALKDLRDQLFSSHQHYDAGWAAVGAHARLPLPAMAKKSADVAKFGFRVEGIFA
jgi:hypothetical protein